jgi:hypothetical protein
MEKIMNKPIMSESEIEALARKLDTFHQIPRPARKQQLLRGTRDIAKYVFDADDKAAVRATFHILETSSSIPALKLGGMWCVYISSLNAKIWAQQKRAWPTEEGETLVRLHIILSALLPSLLALDTRAANDNSPAMVDLVDEAVKTVDRLLHGSKP